MEYGRWKKTKSKPFKSDGENNRSSWCHGTTRSVSKRLVLWSGRQHIFSRHGFWPHQSDRVFHSNFGRNSRMTRECGACSRPTICWMRVKKAGSIEVYFVVVGRMPQRWLSRSAVEIRCWKVLCRHGGYILLKISDWKLELQSLVMVKNIWRLLNTYSYR